MNMCRAAPRRPRDVQQHLLSVRRALRLLLAADQVRRVRGSPGEIGPAAAGYAGRRHEPGTSEVHERYISGLQQEQPERASLAPRSAGPADGAGAPGAPARPAAMICRTARASTVWPSDLDRFLTGLQVRLGGAEALPDVPQIVAAADDGAAARAESRRHRRYCRGTRRHRVPSVAVRENADGAHRPFQGTNPVRHASVDTATQRSTATQGDTRRDRGKRPASHENSQLAGRFRRWWQVLGSNQRRLSRRFYSVPLLFTPYSR